MLGPAISRESRPNRRVVGARAPDARTDRPSRIAMLSEQASSMRARCVQIALYRRTPPEISGRINRSAATSRAPNSGLDPIQLSAQLADAGGQAFCFGAEGLHPTQAQGEEPKP